MSFLPGILCGALGPHLSLFSSVNVSGLVRKPDSTR
jgi:hypothetical protein